MNAIPNLDGLSSTELLTFWHQHDKGRNARALGLSGCGSRKTTAALANYAANKAAAMASRRRGHINVALYYENICERIYASLSTTARW